VSFNLEYAKSDYREFYIHTPPPDQQDNHPRIIMRTLDGYVVFGKERQNELRALLHQIELESKCD
jgi:hypothetical protein